MNWLSGFLGNVANKLYSSWMGGDPYASTTTAPSPTPMGPTKPSLASLYGDAYSNTNAPQPAPSPQPFSQAPVKPSALPLAPMTPQPAPAPSPAPLTGLAGYNASLSQPLTGSPSGTNQNFTPANANFSGPNGPAYAPPPTSSQSYSPISSSPVQPTVNSSGYTAPQFQAVTPPSSPSSGGGQFAPMGGQFNAVTPPGGGAAGIGSSGGSTGGTPGGEVQGLGGMGGMGGIPVSDPEQEKLRQQILSLMQPSADEKSAQAALVNLQGSYNAGAQGIEDKPIPMEEITGEQAALQRQYTNQILPLQQRLALAQAARTSSLDASKFALDSLRTERSDIAEQQKSAREASKPFDVGGQPYMYDASTGKYNPVGQPKSTGTVQEYEDAKARGLIPASMGYFDYLNKKKVETTINSYTMGGSNIGGASLDAQLQGMLNIYQTTGQIPPMGLSANNPLRSMFYAAIGGANGQDIVSGSVTNKAMISGATQALRTQQNQYSANQTAIGTLDKQMQLVQKYSDQVSRTDSPLVNKYLLWTKGQVQGDADTAALNNIITTASNEFAKILSGSAASIAGVTVSSAADAKSILNAAMSKGQLNEVMGLMKQEAQFRLQSQAETIQQIKGDLSNGFSGSGGTNLGNDQYSSQRSQLQPGEILVQDPRTGQIGAMLESEFNSMSTNLQKI